MQKLCDLRIAGKVDVPHIVQPHDAGQRTGVFHRQSVVEHLDLNVRTLDAVIPVRDGVDDQLFPCKLRIFRLGDKAGVCTEVGALLDLAAHKLQRLLNDLQDAAFKYHVLDDILFQFFIHHSTATIFDNNDFPVKTLDIRQCLH